LFRLNLEEFQNCWKIKKGLNNFGIRAQTVGVERMIKKLFEEILVEKMREIVFLNNLIEYN